MMVVAIAAMTLVRALRRNELGSLASLMIVVLWIAVAGGATAIDMTHRRYVCVRVQ